MSPAELKEDLKSLIVETLRPEAVKASDIRDDQLLFAADSGFGFDSIHALELLTAIEYRYKVRFPNDGNVRTHFRSVETLASFLHTMIPAV